MRKSRAKADHIEGRPYGSRSQSLHRQPGRHRRRQHHGPRSEGRSAGTLDGRAPRRGRRSSRARTPQKFPSAAELEAQIETRSYRRGVGNLFVNTRGGKMKKLEPMPKNANLHDFFRLRFAPANHVLQSATRALKTGMSEEVDPRLPAARRGAVDDQGRSRLVGRAVVRALRPGEVDVRHQVSPGAALLSGFRRRLRVSRSVPAHLRPRLHAARSTSRRPTGWCATTSGTWSRAS